MLKLDALQDRALFEARSRDLPDIVGAADSDGSGLAHQVVIGAESAALQQLDIPLHRADHHALLPDSSDRIDGFFTISGRERQSRRVTRLTPPQ